jgi:predicted nucleic acid-binding Zn ribbon protein
MRRKRTPLKKPQSIAQILSGETFGRTGRSLVSIYQLRKNWSGVVGDILAQRTTPKAIQNRTLVVSVENPGWAHHLSMMSEEILKAVLEKTELRFSGIRFVTEKVEPYREPPNSIRRKSEGERPSKGDENLSDILGRIHQRLEDLRKKPKSF